MLERVPKMSEKLPKNPVKNKENRMFLSNSHVSPNDDQIVTHSVIKRLKVYSCCEWNMTPAPPSLDLG